MVSLASWFGDMSRPIAIYCERTSSVWDAEPLNAISNIAFFIAAWAAWRLQQRRPNQALHGSIATLCVIVVMVGIGSTIFHTVARRWAEWADVIPILAFMMAYCWIILTAFFQWSVWLKVLATGSFFLVTFYLESDAFGQFLWGGAMYLPALVFMLAIGLGIWWQDAAAGASFFAAAGVFLLSFAARTLDMPLCNMLSIGTHYLWHIFNAIVLYLLVRTLVLHAPREAAMTFARNKEAVGFRHRSPSRQC